MLENDLAQVIEDRRFCRIQHKKWAQFKGCPACTKISLPLEVTSHIEDLTAGTSMRFWRQHASLFTSIAAIVKLNFLYGITS